MKPPRRQFLHLAAGAIALPAVSRIARAQTYPTRPVRIVVPFGPGGPTDVFARVIAQKLTSNLESSFLPKTLSALVGISALGKRQGQRQMAILSLSPSIPT
jgi:tripartite-type tricarboxylate transporter receptor subunit TctC